MLHRIQSCVVAGVTLPCHLVSGVSHATGGVNVGSDDREGTEDYQDLDD